jgi:hypothetical protein
MGGGLGEGVEGRGLGMTLMASLQGLESSLAAGTPALINCGAGSAQATIPAVNLLETRENPWRCLR